MNITVMYASKGVFNPWLSRWPEFKEAYPFANLVYNYGWSSRPSMVMASRIDRLTSFKELGERIMYDYGISQSELMHLQVAGEKDGVLSAFNTYKQFLDGANRESCSSVVVKSPDDDCWYVLVYDKTLLTDYV